MKEKASKKTIFKYIFLCAFLVVSAVIIVESCLPSSLSSLQSSSCASFISAINGSDQKPVVKPTNVTMSGDEEIPLGYTKRYQVSLEPQNVTDTTLKYTSSNSSILNVVQSGSVAFVEALDYGTATINVLTSSLGVTDSIDVTVVAKPVPQTFSASLSSDEIVVNETSVVEIDVEGFDDEVQAKRFYDFSSIVYESSNETVASVSSLGVIHGISTGSAVISIKKSATSEVYQSVEVNVINGTFVAPTSLSITGTPTAYIYDVDYENIYTALGVSWNGTIPSDDKIIWTSSDELKGIVSSDGKLYGHKKYGTFKVRATSCMDETIYDEIDAEIIEKAPTSVTFSEASEVGQNQSIVIKGTFNPINTTNKTITATSSNPNIIKVMSSSQGQVTLLGVSKGTTSVRVFSSKDSTLYKDYSIEVIFTPTGSFTSFIRKFFGHFGLFVLEGTLGFFVFYLFLEDKKRFSNIFARAGISCVTGFAVAGLSELIQLGVPGRSGDFGDVMIDFGGYVFATAVIVLIILIYRYVKTRKLNKALQTRK